MELYLVFDNIQKPSNVGAVIRLAQAIEAKLIFTGKSIKHTHPKCKGAAVGYIDKAQVTYYETLEECVKSLNNEGVDIHATSPYAETLHWDLDYTAKTAIVFGNEISGLSAKKQKVIGSTTLIPIPGQIESLNLAASAAIVGYEALRQNVAMGKITSGNLKGKPDRNG